MTTTEGSFRLNRIGFGKCRFLTLAMAALFLVAPETGANEPHTEKKAYECVEQRIDAAQQKPCALLISVQVFHPELEREVRINIARKSEDSPLAVNVVEASGSSIEQQLSQLQEENPLASSDALCQRVRLKRYEIAMSQEDIVALVKRFEELSVSPLPSSSITIHGIETSITASTWAATFSYDYSGSGWSEAGNLSPLQDWVRSLFRAVLPPRSVGAASSTPRPQSKHPSSGQEQDG